MIAGGLRTIGAILRATAGFNGNERTDLHFPGLMMVFVYFRRAVYKFKERSIIYLKDFFF
jgi:hypothetical protein